MPKVHYIHMMFCTLPSTILFCLTVGCLVALFHSTNTQANTMSFEVLLCCCGVFVVLAKVMCFVEVMQLLSLPVVREAIAGFN